MSSTSTLTEDVVRSPVAQAQPKKPAGAMNRKRTKPAKAAIVNKAKANGKEPAVVATAATTTTATDEQKTGLDSLAPAAPAAPNAAPVQKAMPKSVKCSTCQKERRADQFIARERERALAGNIGVCKPCHSFNNMLKKHQMTRESYVALLNSRQNACEKCKTAFTEANPPWLDLWPNDKNAVRGILCADCDKAIENVGDTLDQCVAATLYVAQASTKLAGANGKQQQVYEKLCEVRDLLEAK